MRLVKESITEEMYCPLSRNTDSDTRTCLGSRCMAWQWEDLGQFGGNASKGFCGIVATGGMNREQASMPCY